MENWERILSLQQGESSSNICDTLASLWDSIAYATACLFSGDQDILHFSSTLAASGSNQGYYKLSADLTTILKIKHPLIMAPMFLVTNEAMMIAAFKAGITAAIPALNYRTPLLMGEGLRRIEQQERGIVYGVNLIVNRSNPYLDQQLEVVLSSGASYVITSLGNPQKVIEQCHRNNILVFCDVVNLEHALKAQQAGADAVIAVNSGAGGHAGKIAASILLPMLKKELSIPVISAGGVGDSQGVNSMMQRGAAGLSIGSVFIACEESSISLQYKYAVVEYGADDIVMTSKLSGTPCTVINTDYVKKMGTEQSMLFSQLSKNRTLGKFAKMASFYLGGKSLTKAASESTYKTVWCAGPAIEFVDGIYPIAQIVQSLVGSEEE
jgi:nitronate monooxygenase